MITHRFHIHEEMNSTYPLQIKDKNIISPHHILESLPLFSPLFKWNADQEFRQSCYLLCKNASEF